MNSENDDILVTDGSTPDGYYTCLDRNCPHRLPMEGNHGRYYEWRHHHRLKTNAVDDRLK